MNPHVNNNYSVQTGSKPNFGLIVDMEEDSKSHANVAQLDLQQKAIAELQSALDAVNIKLADIKSGQSAMIATSLKEARTVRDDSLTTIVNGTIDEKIKDWETTLAVAVAEAVKTVQTQKPNPDVSGLTSQLLQDIKKDSSLFHQVYFHFQLILRRIQELVALVTEVLKTQQNELFNI